MPFSYLALGLCGWLAVLTDATIATPAFTQPFRLNDIGRDATGAVVVEYQSRPEAYHLLQSGTVLPSVNLPVAARLGIEGSDELRDGTGIEAKVFYQVLEIPLDQPRDTDGDGIDDVYELERPAQLNPLDAADASQLAPGGGGKAYLQDYVEQRAPLTTPSDTSPFTRAAVSMGGRAKSTFLSVH